MTDRENVIRALENCNARPKCKDCPWEPCEEFDCKHSDYPDGLIQQALALLKGSFTPKEVYDTVIEHSQHDTRFKLGDKIDYSFMEVVDILNMELLRKAGVIRDGRS